MTCQLVCKPADWLASCATPVRNNDGKVNGRQVARMLGAVDLALDFHQTLAHFGWPAKVDAI